MAITAESLALGASDPWDFRNPVLNRALNLEEDPVLISLAERQIVTAAKLIALRGLQEVPRDEKTIVVAAELAVNKICDGAPQNSSTDEAKRWLDPGSFPPYAEDFSYIQIKWIENGLQESPFLGLAYENLPLRNEKDRLAFNDNVAIFSLRKQLEAKRADNTTSDVTTTRPKRYGRMRQYLASRQILDIQPSPDLL